LSAGVRVPRVYTTQPAFVPDIPERNNINRTGDAFDTGGFGGWVWGEISPSSARSAGDPVTRKTITEYYLSGCSVPEISRRPPTIRPRTFIYGHRRGNPSAVYRRLNPGAVSLPHTRTTDNLVRPLTQPPTPRY